jgi:hypothetical protein
MKQDSTMMRTRKDLDRRLTLDGIQSPPLRRSR